ncbi:LOW QUALITY PROTEIN: hypothetical protein U9M48_036311, partial [Paspalum notatum var. saurae]
MAFIREGVDEKKRACFTLDDQGVLWFKNQLVVPKDMELRKKILDEAHTSMFTMHPGSNKIYQDLKQKFWWTQIAKYVSECDVCQRIKADHLKPAGMLQPLALPAWKWEDIHMDFIVEFAYNNSYQKSLEMASFEGSIWKKITPLNCSELGERPNLVTQAEEQVRLIHSNLKSAQSRQKSYCDKRRRPLVFEVGNYVYLRVSPMNGVHRFGVKGSWHPDILVRSRSLNNVGQLLTELPPHLAAVHDVFHVSQLKKCLRVSEEAVDTSQIQIEPDLTYEERPIKILDQKQRTTRRRTINFYKEVLKETTAAALWLKLEQLCMTKDLTSKMHLKQKLFLHKLQDGGK